MNEDTAHEMVGILLKLTDELRILNDNVNYLASRIATKHFDENLEIALKNITDYLDTYRKE